MKRIILVTGGRTYQDASAVFRALDVVHLEKPISLLIEGGASGADTFARQWAIEHNVHHATISAIWYPRGGSDVDRAAGPKRNSVMADLNIDLGVAFPGNTGTADMVEKLRAAGVEVREIR